MNKITTNNPKDLLGIKKVQLALLPGPGVIEGARAMEFGAEKYGPYNWRDRTVSYSVYLNAMLRHMYSLLDGQDAAPDSGVHHLGHIIANAAILLDARASGKLIDDRPTKGKSAEMIDFYTKK